MALFEESRDMRLFVSSMLRLGSMGKISRFKKPHFSCTWISSIVKARCSLTIWGLLIRVPYSDINSLMIPPSRFSYKWYLRILFKSSYASFVALDHLSFSSLFQNVSQCWLLVPLTLEGPIFGSLQAIKKRPT